MGLRIRTNVASLKAQRHLGIVNDAQTNTMEKLSSGFRINKSADDAAGLAISETMTAKTRSAEQARRNASDGISLIQVAEGSFSEMNNIMVRLRELATQSASDTIGNKERIFANHEYTQLVQEIDRIANSSEFNGYKLLKGSEANGGIREMSIHVGIGDDTFPNVDTVKVDIEQIKMDTEVLGLGSGAEIGPLEVGEEFERSSSAQKLTVLDDAIRKVSGARALLGAKQSRLMSTINNLGVQLENMNSSKSRIKDVDFATEMATFTQQRILSQAGAAVLTQSNQVPELVLSLLR